MLSKLGTMFAITIGKSPPQANFFLNGSNIIIEESIL